MMKVLQPFPLMQDNDAPAVLQIFQTTRIRRSFCMSGIFIATMLRHRKPVIQTIISIPPVNSADICPQFPFRNPNQILANTFYRESLLATLLCPLSLTIQILYLRWSRQHLFGIPGSSPPSTPSKTKTMVRDYPNIFIFSSTSVSSDRTLISKGSVFHSKRELNVWNWL
jgi:hypothetical protein